jgi:serine/threonine protein kinase
MTSERWRAIDRVWQAVLSRAEHERPAAIVELSKGDDGLRRDVESLLEHLGRANSAGFGRAPLEVHAHLASLVGRQLGTYSVHTLLGVGGMGEVYGAYDATLGREVALKILPQPWLADPDRRARFDREARVLASLNHPNIGAIYGVHESDGVTSTEHAVRALVLELVEGETLAARIARLAAPDGKPRGLAIPDVVAIGRQLIDALEAAHDRDIVHRDLKPANIKIRPDGRVKVLDFGLARAVSAADRALDSPLDRAPDISVTGVGVLLGTATYMSPEQARGRVVDKRTDIWSFGCVLYEMLTGVSAFGGADIAETLANVIRAEPDWSALPADTPSAHRLCLRRCLQKDLDQRIRDVADVRLAMEGAFDAQEVDLDQNRRGVRPTRSVVYGGCAVAVLAAAVIVPSLGRSSPDAPNAIAQVTSPPVLLNPRAGGGEGSATAPTIQQAIDMVAPGGTVTILPGTYPQALRITKGLTLQAAGVRSGRVTITPPGSAESAIEIATAEPVVLRDLTIHVTGASGIRGLGGVNVTIERSTILAVNPPPGSSSLIVVSNDRSVTGVRARAVVRDSSIDGTVVELERRAPRPHSIGVDLEGDVDGLVERNVIRRAGAICVRVQTRPDFGGETNVDITNNDIDDCHPVARVSSILVGSPPIATLSSDRPVTATGMVNIIGNTIRNSSQDCLSSAIAYDVFGGRIERNRIVNVVQPCATMTSRNRVGAISIGLRVTGIQKPRVVPAIRFNDIHGNYHAGLHIMEDQILPIDASCNYWGTEKGPSGVGPGDGDAILVQQGAPPPVFLPFAKTPVANPAGRCAGRPPG